MSRIINAAAAETRGLKSGVYTGAPGGTPSSGNVTASFPRGDLGAEDPRDELVRMKQEFLKGNNEARTPFGVVQADEKDFQWLQRKRETEVQANFYQWVTQNFHTHDVTRRKWLQEVMPDFYDTLEKELVDRVKLATRIKLILMRGPKNEKDLVLIFALENGLVKLDRDWDRVGPSMDKPDQGEEQKRFKANLLNPPRYQSDARRGKQQFENNPFKPKGATGGSAQEFAFAGGGVAADSAYPDFLKNVLQKYL